MTDKTILWRQESIPLPILDGSHGNGSIRISTGLYHEYSHKLLELLILADRIRALAIAQGRDA